MTEDTKRIWRTHLPFHLLFLGVALIAYFKVDTVVGFWILAASLALTAVFDLMARRYRKDPESSGERKDESSSTPV